MIPRPRWATALAAMAVLVVAAPADAEPEPFEAAVTALSEQRPQTAIANLESLADQGVVDAQASYNRGLAYAMRARLAAQPGDLGRAIHALEEARSLTSRRDTRDAAQQAIVLLRSDVARRRARLGEPAVVQPAPPLHRTLAHVLPEDLWAILALVSASVFGLGLFLRAWGKGRVRLTGVTASGVSTLGFAVSLAATLVARHERLHVEEGVVVAESARVVDDKRAPIASESPLPEGTRLEIVGRDRGYVAVRLPSRDAWIADQTILTIAKVPVE